jgi:hypothetical protein
MSKRKAFNFYISYFDVYNEIESNDEKLQFIDALLKKQFLGIEPTELKGLAKFGYNSQKEMINSQVVGWEKKTKTTLGGVAKGGIEPLTDPPLPQEKEKEEEKEKEDTNNKVDVDDIYEKLKPSYKTYAKQLLSDSDFCEAIYRNTLKVTNFEVGQLTLIKYLKEFLIHLDEYKNLHHTKKAFSHNFSNWFKMQKDKGKVTLVYPKKEPKRYV